MTLEERIPLTKLGTILKAADSVAGLHLGACSIGKAALMKKVLKRTSLKWIAAYDREVPWLESTALDLLFWSWIYSGAPRPKRSRRLTPESAAHELYRGFNVAREMGFRVMFRDEDSDAITSSWDTWEAPSSPKT